MKPISFEIDECPMSGKVTSEGHFTFNIYATNECIGENLEKHILAVADLWNSEALREIDTEVMLTINMKLRDLFTELVGHYGDRNNVIEAEAMPVFNALRQDCQWILDQIAQLKFEEETT
jgi:hypothetical protein